MLTTRSRGSASSHVNKCFLGASCGLGPVPDTGGQAGRRDKRTSQGPGSGGSVYRGRSKQRADGTVGLRWALWGDKVVSATFSRRGLGRPSKGRFQGGPLEVEVGQDRRPAGGRDGVSRGTETGERRPGRRTTRRRWRAGKCGVCSVCTRTVVAADMHRPPAQTSRPSPRGSQHAARV